MFYKGNGLMPTAILAFMLQSGHLAADWTIPSNLSPAGDAENVRLSVDPSGNAYANWQYNLSGTQIIQSSVLPFGGSWSSPINVSDPSDAINDHELAVDLAGNAYAVWNPITGNQQEFILATYRPSGFTWLASTILQNSALETNPRVAALYYGTATAVWTGTSGTNSIIQSANFANSNWILPAVVISDPTQNSDNSAIGLDYNGDAYAVWESNNGTNITIQSATRLSGVWSSPVNLSYANDYALEPQIAVNSNGMAVAIWKRYDCGNWIVEAATFVPNIGWTLPVELSYPGEDADLPQIAIDDYGNAVAVWKRSDGSNNIIQSSQLSNGSLWLLPVSLSLAGEDADTPKISSNNSGQYVAAWSRSNGTNAVVEIASINLQSGASWSAPTDLSAAGADALLPQVTVDPSGNSVVAWQYGSSGAYVIQSSSGTNLFQ